MTVFPHSFSAGFAGATSHGSSIALSSTDTAQTSLAEVALCGRGANVSDQPYFSAVTSAWSIKSVAAATMPLFGRSTIP